MARRANAGGPAQASADVPGAQGADPTDDERAEHVDIDPTTGESYGTQVTPDEGSGDAAPPAPPTDDDTPAGSPRDAAMEAIRARARESREAEIAAARESETDQLQMLEHTAGAADAPADDDDAEAAPAAGAEQPQPAAAEADYVTINVRGEERQLPIRMDQLREEFGDDADEAVRQIQKHYAGDQRMQEALAYEQRLQTFHDRLNTVRDNLLRGLDENGQPLSPQAQPSRTGTPSPRQPSSADAGPSAQDATAQQDEAKLRERAKNIREKLYSGEEDQAEEAIFQLLSDVEQGRAPATPPSVDESVVDQRIAAALEAREARQQVVNANEVFRDEFSAIHDDERLMRHARTEYEYQRDLPENQGKSQVELARLVGKTVSRDFGLDGQDQPAGADDAAAEQQAADELAQRRKLKSRTPTPPVSTAPSQRHQPPQESQPSMGTGSDYVNKLNQIRGKASG